MNTKIIKQQFIIFSVLFVGSFTASAQMADLKLVSSAAKTISNNTHSVDFTIGECVTANISNAFNVFTIGFLQPSNIQIPAAAAASNNVLLYPVPAVTEINYLLNDSAFLPTGAQILSSSGSILQSVIIPANLQNGQIFKFNISTLSSGIYRIRFFNSTGQIRVGRFIKF